MFEPVCLQDVMMHSAAFQDVCHLAEAAGADAWRRKMVFAQESGDAWQQIGTACMDEVSNPAPSAPSHSSASCALCLAAHGSLGAKISAHSFPAIICNACFLRR